MGEHQPPSQQPPPPPPAEQLWASAPPANPPWPRSTRPCARADAFWWCATRAPTLRRPESASSVPSAARSRRGSTSGCGVPRPEEETESKQRQPPHTATQEEKIRLLQMPILHTGNHQINGNIVCQKKKKKKKKKKNWTRKKEKKKKKKKRRQG